MAKVRLFYGQYVILREKAASAQTMLQALGSIERIAEFRRADQPPPIKVRDMHQGRILSLDPHQIVPISDEAFTELCTVYATDRIKALRVMQAFVRDFADEVVMPEEGEDFYKHGERFTVETIGMGIQTGFTPEQKAELEALYYEDPNGAVDRANEIVSEMILAEEAKPAEPLPILPVDPEYEAKCGPVEVVVPARPKTEPGTKFSIRAWKAMQAPPKAAVAPPPQTEKHLGFRISEQQPKPAPVFQVGNDLQALAASRTENYCRDLGDGYSVVLYPRVGNQRADITLANFIIFAPEGDIPANHINVSRQDNGIYTRIEDKDSHVKLPIPIKARVFTAVKELFYAGKIIEAASVTEVRGIVKNLQRVPC
jgi:hypothetical protein